MKTPFEPFKHDFMTSRFLQQKKTHTVRVREGRDDMLDWQGEQAETESALDLWHQLRHQLMSSLGMCPSRHTLH